MTVRKDTPNTIRQCTNDMLGLPVEAQPKELLYKPKTQAVSPSCSYSTRVLGDLRERAAHQNGLYLCQSDSNLR